MRIEILVAVEVSFASGKFAPRDDIVEELKGQLSDPGSLSVGEGEYNVDGWEVEEHSTMTPKELARRRKMIVDAVLALEHLAESVTTPLHGKKDRVAKLAADLRRAFNILDPKTGPALAP